MRTMGLAALMMVATLSASVQAADQDAGLRRPGLALLMIEEAGCGYCRRWHAEVGRGYPLSSEGKLAPLVTRDRFDGELRRFGRVVYTPTFILLRDGEEAGRILGYPGADFFWSLLGELLQKSVAAGNSGSEAAARPLP